MVAVAVLVTATAFAADQRVSDAQRLDILRRAQVWSPLDVPIPQAQLGGNPPGADGFADDQLVECRFEAHGVGGSTPKFDCRLPSGEVVK